MISFTDIIRFKKETFISSMDILQSTYSLHTIPVLETSKSCAETLRGKNKTDKFVITSEPFHTLAENTWEGFMYSHYSTFFPKSSLDILYGIPISVGDACSIKMTFHTKNSQVELNFNEQEINNNTIFYPTSWYGKKNRGCSFEYLFCPFECGFPVACFNKVDIEVNSLYANDWNFCVAGVILSAEHRKSLLQTKNFNMVVDTEPNSSVRSKLNYLHYSQPKEHTVTKLAINYMEPFMCYRMENIKTLVMMHK
jgi:hypothetical protein